MTLEVPSVRKDDWTRLRIIIDKLKHLSLGVNSSPTFIGITLSNTGLHLLDTNASHNLIVAPGSDLTADRTLTLTTGDSDRTITLSGNPTLGDWFDQSVKVAASPTYVGLTVTGNSVFGLNSSVFQPATNSTTFFQVLDADGGTPVLNVDTTNERIGIGTATPGSKLHVEHTSYPVIRGVRTSAATNAVSATLDFLHKTSSNMTDGFGGGVTASIQDVTAGPYYIAGFYGVRSGSDTTGSFAIYTRNAGAWSEKMRVTNTGYVGINEIAPETLLELTHATPYITLHNSTGEDTDGGRESRINFKGEQGVDPFEETTLARIEVSHDGTGADDKGKLVISINDGDDGDTPTQALEIGSDLLVTSSGVIRGATSLWWRIQHIDLSALPATGAVGAVYTPQSANNLNGYQLDNAPSEEYLYFNTHVGTDWDETSDLELVVQFETNVDNSGGAGTDTVDFDLLMYYKGATETTQKTQDLDASVVVGTAAQFYHSLVTFTIDHDLADHVVQIGDCVSFRLHLNTTDSEVDNVIVHHAMFRYKTNKVRAEV